MHEIRLVLARDHDFPEGSTLRGYIVHAPLDSDGKLDQAAWRAHAPACTVLRFWAGEDDQRGRLIHGRHGWLFTYGGEEEDEPLFRLGEHRLVPGEYVSITEHDGIQRTFRVAGVRRLPG